MDRILWDCDFVAVDIETTGLSPRWDRIVEIGALRFSPGVEVEGFETFVNPGRAIPPGAMAIHGITDEMVANAPPLDRVVHDLAVFLGDAPLVFHNPAFDLGFLDQVMEDVDPAWRTRVVFDSCELARKAFPEAKKYSLVALAHTLGLEGSAHHRALGDCQYCAALFHRILEVVDGLRCMLLRDLAEEYRYRP